MSLIQIQNLTFSYDSAGEPVFQNASVSFDTDWKLGLIGRNGRGKTTLLRLLEGAYSYTGQITASVSFTYFPYPVTEPDRMVIEIAEEIAPDAQQWQIIRELSLLQTDDEILWRPFSTLSKGEQTKLLLAVLFLRENSFLLIDEPTNHLDRVGRAAVGTYLSKKKGFLLVSHDRNLLDGCINHVLSINRTGFELQRGNFSSWDENRHRQERFELGENAKLHGEIKRLTSAARRASGWSDRVEGSKYSDESVDRGFIGHQSAKMMKRAKVLEKRRSAAIAEKETLLKNVEQSFPLKLSPLSFRLPRLVFGADFSPVYDGAPVFKPMDFEIRRGERIALTGKNGAGKSSLIKVLLGEDVSSVGTLQKPADLRVSYVPQDTSFLRGSLSDFAVSRGIEESLLRAILNKLAMENETLLCDLSELSAGQKKKILLAGSLCEQAHLYIWDEPLNFIDVLSRMQIEELLLHFPPTMLFVEHDAAFCERIATRTIGLAAIE